MEKEILEKLNQKYLTNDRNGSINGVKNFHVNNGIIPVILSAPHAVKQWRNNKIKDSEYLTGPLVEYLSMLTGCYSIIREYNMMDDPNFDFDGIGLEYKKEIVDLIKKYQIKLLIDIHGCSNKYHFDFDIGTNNGININNQVSELIMIARGLNKIGVTKIDDHFLASNDYTICNYVNKNSGISSIQLEISNAMRLKNSIKLLHSLKDIILNINELYKTDDNKKLQKELQ